MRMPLLIRATLLIAALQLALIASSLAQTNPFTGKPADGAAQIEAAPPPDSPGLFTAIGREVMRIQSDMNRALSRQMRAVRDDASALPLLIGLALAGLYGAVHVAGPGHGKLVIVSYFLGREANLGRGLLLGLQIAATHVVAAIVLVALADIVLRETFGGAPGEMAAVRILSYATIAIIGILMLVDAARDLRRSRLGQPGAPNAHALDEHDRHDHAIKTGACHAHGGGQHGILSFAVGLVPCTGATLIMLYALANDILFAGILMVVAIGIGMALAMAAIGIATILLRQGVMSRARSTGTQGRLALALHFGGGLAVTALGGSLLATTLLSR